MTILNETAAVAALQTQRLAVALRTYAKGWTPDPDSLWLKLLSAEKELSRRLRISLEPVEIFPGGPTADEITALAGAPWEEEPGYDYSPSFFQGDAWGFIQLRRRPVIQIHSVRFVYPAPVVVWDVPADWIRVDKRYGQVRIVPGAGSFSMPIAAVTAQMMGGGRSIPHMIQVRYRAGLDDAADEHPDVIDLIYKMAALSVVQDALPPGSFSESIDGMSQNFSVELAKLGDHIDAKIDSLRQYFQGVRMAVL